MRYICIHSHFYQPPRENPWLEAIELQDSAYPYHDWNERISAECYAPNAAARILDGEGRIVRIENNYSRISFNFGPTLLSWIESQAPDLLADIVEADRTSRERFSGHGSALAQAYNHMILPLSNSRDKETQILWGVRDFEHRFHRPPEGMWLPETAVDLESLRLMAKHGIKFTILAPHQARRIRKIGARSWHDVHNAGIDPSMAYRLRLPDNSTIALFFYDGPVSRAVAFEGLLNNGEHFAQRLMSVYSDARTWPQLAHIATDGESYGHHHHHGEMALAYALHHIEAKGLARLTNYAEYLERHPPTHEVEIFEDTSWSCLHGVERWRSNCGCNSGGRPGWTQEWRAPLRSALNWLRDCVMPLYEEAGARLFPDVWAARNAYIDIILDRSPASRELFLSKHAIGRLTPEDQTIAWKLLELQRHAMLMYTSCGWFFDDLSGLETVQVIRYAGRVVQLAEDLCPGRQIEAQFLTHLAAANSNLAEHGNGAQIYDKFVKPALVDLQKVGAHYAVSSLFESYPESAPIYCYTAEREDYRSVEAGKLHLAIGRARFISGITQESGILSFGVLHFGDHNLNGAVRQYRGEEEYNELALQAKEAFFRADIPQVIRILDKGFGENIYSLKSLFRDEQRKILKRILNTTLEEAGAVYRQLYEHHAPLMRFLVSLGIPLPKALRTTAEYALNLHLKHAMAAEELDVDRIKSLLEEARAGQIELDSTTLEFTLRKSLERLALRFASSPADAGLLDKLTSVVDLLALLPFDVDLWTIQNVFYKCMRSVYPEVISRAERGNPEAKNWVARFRPMAEKLKLRIA